MENPFDCRKFCEIMYLRLMNFESFISFYCRAYRDLKDSKIIFKKKKKNKRKKLNEINETKKIIGSLITQVLHDFSGKRRVMYSWEIRNLDLGRYFSMTS